MSYDEYLTAITTVNMLTAKASDESSRIDNQLESAIAEAHAHPRAAVKETEYSKRTIHAQQSAGRDALKTIDQEGLLPARVRPGRSAGPTTQAELEKLVEQHRFAVGRLEAAVRQYRQAVQDDIERRQAAAQREAEERSRRRAEAEATAARDREAEEVGMKIAALAAKRRQTIIVSSAVGLGILILGLVLLAL